MDKTWEDSKSLRPNAKYKTGHTYKRLSETVRMHLTHDQTIFTDYYGYGYKGISLNKNKNWEFVENSKLFDDRPSNDGNVEMKTIKKNRHELELRKKIDDLVSEPIVKIKRDKKMNKQYQYCSFLDPEQVKSDIMARKKDEIEKPKKTQSRKAKRKMKENRDRIELNDPYRYSKITTIAYELPIAKLDKGKCWKMNCWYPDPNYTIKNDYQKQLAVYRARKHRHEKQMLAIHDQKCIVKDLHAYKDRLSAQEIVSFILNSESEIDRIENEHVTYKPLYGKYSFVDKDKMSDRIERELLNDPIEYDEICFEDDEFYICQPDDWIEMDSNRRCGICFEESDDGQLLKWSDRCEHVACSTCWRKYISDCINSSDRVNKEMKMCCFNESCHQPIDMKLLTKIVSPHELKWYIKSYCQLTISNDHQLIECKTESCKNLILKSSGGDNSGISVCECNYMICNKCCNDAHYPLDCNDVKSCRSVITDESQLDNYLILGKHCPACNSFIIKDGGCSHMSCYCRHQFCWNCLVKYKSTHNCSTPNDNTFRLKAFLINNIDISIDTELISMLNWHSPLKPTDSIKTIMSNLRVCKSVDFDKICLMDEYYSCLEDEREDDEVVVSLPTYGFKMLYFYLKKVALDIEQYNSFCVHFAFEIVSGKEGKERKMSNKIILAFKNCKLINEMFITINNWQQLASFLTKYKQLKENFRKINFNK